MLSFEVSLYMHCVVDQEKDVLCYESCTRVDPRRALINYKYSYRSSSVKHNQVYDQKEKRKKNITKSCIN